MNIIQALTYMRILHNSVTKKRRKKRWIEDLFLDEEAIAKTDIVNGH